MARFNFRLQQYLGVKMQIEEQKELEYAKAIRMLEEEKRVLADMHRRKDEAVEELRKLVSRAISPIEIRRYNNNIERLKHQISVQIERVAAAEAYVETKRQELIQAMKERKALEIVKEAQYEEFLKEQDLAERKIVDELVSFKYADRENPDYVSRPA